MTLNEVMKDTADAIREKTGKSELIAPVDFASEIKGITTGGESGGGTMEYLDVSGFNVENDDELSLKESLILLSVVVKIPKSFSVTVDIPIGTGVRITTIERGIYPGAQFASNIGMYTWDNYKVAKKQTVNSVSVVAVDFSQLMTLDGNLIDIQEIIALLGLTEIIDSIPRLTKEQFYDLNA